MSLAGFEGARLLASGLRFPEGPVALDDGSLLVCELEAGRLTRVADGEDPALVAQLGGSPNGAALGPDGSVWVANSGGWCWTDLGGGFLVPQGPGEVTQPEGFAGGSIQRVDLASGEFETIYTECAGHRLNGPNDLVFDAEGGFWFSDYGKQRARDVDRGGVYYARADGSSIVEAAFPLDSPNGIGLSPDGAALYVAETHTGRLWEYQVVGPGQLGTKRLAASMPGAQFLDSLAVEADGRVCVATITEGGIAVVAPDGSVEFVAAVGEWAEPVVTNICFGGPDRRTAYITLSATGRLIACDWPRPGLSLHGVAR